ncbi:sensor histidine kinase [Roseovarius dicentrarchi]|uniref:sensor histidine kinase n=1 Tax=Roseovarius dicentrarchi TaxID=2250573 RepID=UPI000DEB8AE8|nr:ATP-binding protein [Roseovarius dicentrarchi]
MRFLASAVLVSLLAALIGTIGPLPDLEGVVRHDTAQRCRAGTNDCTTVTLPDRLSRGDGPVEYRLEVARGTLEGDLKAVLIQRMSDSYALRIGNTPLSPPLDPGRQGWSRPVLALVPGPVLTDADMQTLVITLSALPPREIRLAPVLIGAHDTLLFRSNLVMILRIGMQRIAFGLCIFGVIAFVGLDMRPETRTGTYRYLAAACAAAAIVLLGGVFIVPFLPLMTWIAVWTTAAHLAIFAFCRFLALHVGRRPSGLEAAWLAAIILGAGLLFVLPAEIWRLCQLAISMVDLVFLTLATAGLMAPPRRDRNSEDYVMLLPMATGSALLALYWLELVGVTPVRTIETIQFAPIAFMCVAFTHVVGQAVIGQRLSDRFAARLSSEVTLRSGELIRTHETIRKMERERAIEAERQRIILDLHDGLGGQLINMQAYLENSDIQDETLENAIASAMADLAIIMDSIDAEDDVTTLLGSLRNRIEPMLTRNNLRFDWRIEEPPAGLTASPAHSVMLLRIVQEALTNIVKHAQADTIIMECTRDHIAITDNGNGMADGQRAGGRGLSNIRSRAATINAALDITTGPAGTRISLRWDPPQPGSGIADIQPDA